MDPFDILVVSVLLALLLGSAAMHKASDLASFRVAVTGYRIIPSPLIGAFAVTLPVLEGAAALLLLFNGTRHVGGALAGALLTIYAGSIALNLLRGRTDLACGCSWGAGSAGPRIAWSMVFRNVVLTGMAVMVAAVEFSREPLWLDLFSGVCGGLVVALLWVTLEALLRNHSLMSARRS